MVDIMEEELDEMASVDVRTVDINTLTDLRDINIDTHLAVEQKLTAFARQTNNMYVHRIGEYIVKVQFQKEGPSIDDIMEDYLKKIVKI